MKEMIEANFEKLFPAPRVASKESLTIDQRRVEIEGNETRLDEIEPILGELQAQIAELTGGRGPQAYMESMKSRRDN
jgi:hypothetical protein